MDMKVAIDHYNSLEHRLAAHKESIKKEMKENFDLQNEDLKDYSKKLSLAIFKMTEIEPTIKNIQSSLFDFEQTGRSHSKKLEEIAKQIRVLQDTKTELKVHNEFKAFMEGNLRDMTGNYQLQIDRMLNTENYIEKYLPLFF